MAQIIVPYSIHSNTNWVENVQIQNSIHSNHPIKSQKIAHFFTEEEIAAKIEAIYYSEEPHCTRYKTYNLLLEFLRKNSEDNQTEFKVNKNFFDNIYNKLEISNKITEQSKIFKNERGEIFEIFNINFKKNETEIHSIICYSSQFQLSLIQNVSIIGIDCTFLIAPPKFKQVMVMIGKTKKLNVPLAYFLLPSKNQDVYKMAFQNFKFFISNFSFGTTFICDFEIGEINAIKGEFIQNGLCLQLCYFHFIKAIKHFFAENIKNINKSDELNLKKTISNYIKKCVKMFPFIPHNKVYYAIEILKGYSESIEFANYFSSTYLSRYDINDWSTYNKMQKSTVTNNIVERHNRRLNDLFQHSHPSLNEFKIKLSKLENEYFNMYNNSDEKDDIVIKHYSEDDFDKTFNFLQNYLKNHGKQITKLPQQPKEFINTSLNDFSDMKHLPDLIIRTKLVPALKQYFQAPERSEQRRDIIQKTVDEINNPIMTFHKVRLWFNNNRDKYSSYELNDDHLTPIDVHFENDDN